MEFKNLKIHITTCKEIRRFSGGEFGDKFVGK